MINWGGSRQSAFPWPLCCAALWSRPSSLLSRAPWHAEPLNSKPSPDRHTDSCVQTVLQVMSPVHGFCMVSFLEGMDITHCLWKQIITQKTSKLFLKSYLSQTLKATYCNITTTPNFSSRTVKLMNHFCVCYDRLWQPSCFRLTLKIMSCSCPSNNPFLWASPRQFVHTCFYQTLLTQRDNSNTSNKNSAQWLELR